MNDLRSSQPKTWGVLERWWAVEWARMKADLYAMFHPSCRVYIENTWVEDRNHKDLHGEAMFKEYITYIAVIKGTIQKGDLRVVKEYFGALRIPLEAYNEPNQEVE